MPTEIHCPSCERKLRVPDDLLGQAVKCPSCQATFTAAADQPPAPARRPAPPPPPEDAFQEEEPPPRPRRRRRPVEEEEDEDEDYVERPRVSRRAAASAVAGPAISLMIIAGIAIGLYLLSFVLNMLGIGLGAGRGRGQGGPEAIGQALGGILGTVIGICWWGTVLAGAAKMKNLQGYGYAMTACILSVLPCIPCCVLTLPFAIWGLVVLNRPDVKNAFS